jgi:hypothetical protein
VVTGAGGLSVNRHSDELRPAGDGAEVRPLESLGFFVQDVNRSRADAALKCQQVVLVGGEQFVECLVAGGGKARRAGVPTLCGCPFSVNLRLRGALFFREPPRVVHCRI